MTQAAADAVRDLDTVLAAESPLTVKSVRADVQARMSDRAGILCTGSEVATALADARTVNAKIKQNGIAVSRPSEAARTVQWQQMALASEAVLCALDTYISNGGGSRGARAICDHKGAALPATVQGPIAAARFRAERDADKDQQLIVTYDGAQMHVSSRDNRRHDGAHSFFERDWPAWLTGDIFQSGGKSA